jgi:hypothetical protein
MLSPTRLGLAGGILWGISLFLMTLLSIWTQYGSQFLSLVADIYPGYSTTPAGSIIGLFWGFLDGFLGLFILAWLYNKLGTQL